MLGAPSIPRAMAALNLLRRVAAVVCLVAWSVWLLVGSWPPELRPPWAEDTVVRARGLLAPLGLAPSHFVFPGIPGDVHKRYFAIRVTGVTPEGSAVVLDEWPEGLVQPDLRIREHPASAVWYRTLTLKLANRLLRVNDPAIRAHHLARLREHHRLRLIGRFYCTSALYAHHGTLDSIRIDAWWATESYRTGAVVPHAAVLRQQPCWKGAPMTVVDTVPGPRPAWDFPGLDWGDEP